MEFSMAAIFPSNPCDLCGRRAALKPGSPIPASAALGLALLTSVAAFIFRTTGSYAFPLTWILLGLASVWVVWRSCYVARSFELWIPAAITFCALLATYLCIPTNCGVPRYNFSQELLKPSPLDPQRLYLERVSMGGAYLCYDKQAAASRPNPSAGKHFDVGGLLRQRLQSDPRCRCRA